MIKNFLFCCLCLSLSTTSHAQTCIGSAGFKHGPGFFQFMETYGDNLVVCGGVSYNASYTYDGTTITAPPGAYATCYVVMTDTNFNLIRMFNHVSFYSQGGPFNDLRIWGMAIDPQLNVLFTGSYADSLLVYGNDTIVSDDYQEGFVAKSDSTGQPLMFKSFGSRNFSANYKYEDRGHCITTDAAGNIYVGASFGGDYLQVNSDTVHNAVSVGLNGYKQAAAFSLTPTGQTRWITAFGARTHDDSPFGIAVDSHGFVTVCGSTEASNQDFYFDTITYHFKSSPNAYQSFTGQFDSSGNARWFYPVETYSGSTDVSAYDVVFDDKGNSYTAGFFDGYAIFNSDTIKTLNYTSSYLLKIDSTGHRVFVKIGNIDTFYPYPCALKLKDDKIFLTGQTFTNRLIFEPYGVCCSNDVYFTMYDTAGTVIYLKGLAGTGGVNAGGYDVAFTASGVGLATGGFSGGTITIDPNTATATGTEYYLVRFGNIASNGLTMSLTNNGSDTIACGAFTQLQMTVSPSSNTRFFWSADNDTIPGPFYNATLNATPKLNTTYYAVAYNNGCVVIDSINVAVEQLPVAAGNDTAACEGSIVQLSGNTITNGLYHWYPSAGLDFDTIYNPVLLVDSTRQYVYEISNTAGCRSYDTLQVTALYPPLAGFSASSNNLQLTFSDLSVNAVSYAWDFGDGNTDTSPSPVHTYNSSGNYMVCLVVTNDCGTDTLCQQYTLTNVGMEEVSTNVLIVDKAESVEIVLENFNSASFILYDMTGKRVLEKKIQNRNTFINKQELGSGIYIINVSGDSFCQSRKILVR